MPDEKTEEKNEKEMEKREEKSPQRNTSAIRWGRLSGPAS